MLLPQAALVPVTTPIEVMIPLSRNKITKVGLNRQNVGYKKKSKKKNLSICRMQRRTRRSYSSAD